MTILILILVACVVGFFILLTLNSLRGQAIAKCYCDFEAAYDYELRQTGLKAKALQEGFRRFKTCPVLNVISDSRWKTVAEVVSEADNPKDIIHNIVIGLPSDMLVTAFINTEKLKSFVHRSNLKSDSTHREFIRKTPAASPIDATKLKAISVSDEIKSSDANTAKQKMSQEELDKLIKHMSTPAGSIATWAYNLSGDLHDELVKRPRIAQYKHGKKLGNFLQAGTIIAGMIHIERQLGEHDYTALHRSVAQYFAPSVKELYMGMLKSLMGSLLAIDPKDIPDDTIPSFEELKGRDDITLAAGIGAWLVESIKEGAIDSSDNEVAAHLGRLVYEVNGKTLAMFVLSGDKKFHE